MNITSTTLLIGTALLLALGTAAASTLEDVATVKQRFIASVLPVTPEGKSQVAEAAGAAINTQRTDGSWPDVNYAGTSTMEWELKQHLLRTLVLAKAYRTPEQAWHGSSRIKQGALMGITYWQTHDYTSSNWWWNQIGVPQLMAEILLLMEPDITEAQKAKGIEIITRSKWSPGGGENTVWPASNTVLRGALMNDPAVVADGFRGIYGEIRMVAPGAEGIQADYSFHQHGAQFYSGGYGYMFSNDIGRFSSFAWGTSFQIPEATLDVLNGYLLDGQQWMVRSPVFDYSAVGREITRLAKVAVPESWAVGPISPVGAAYGLDSAVRMLSEQPVPRQDEYAAFAARMRKAHDAPAFSGNRHFWRSDYQAHHRPGYMASVRMFSNRLVNTENTGNEGRYLHHIADGANFLYRDGSEYRDIFPLWDWEKIPGTTVEQGLGFDPAKVRCITPATFVGGVSDGLYGAAAMDVIRDNVRARKSWFFFDDVYACLGAGISVGADHSAITTLNQAWWRGPVTVSGRTEPLTPGTQGLMGVSWVHHDGVAYVFPKPVTAWVDVRQKAGRWSSIGQGSTDLVSGDVFSLWLSHGTRPTDASYAYLVAPGADVTRAASFAAESPIEILSNTKSLQAVRHRSARVLQAAFWVPGTVTAGSGWTVSVDQPCIVQVRETKDGVRLAVSNPMNAALTLNLSIDRALFGPGAVVKDGSTTLALELPAGTRAGSSLVLDLSGNTARAAQIAAGLVAATPEDVRNLDVAPGEPGGAVDLLDAAQWGHP